MRWVTHTPQWCVEGRWQRAKVGSLLTSCGCQGIDSNSLASSFTHEAILSAWHGHFLGIQYKDCNNLSFKCFFFIIIVCQISTPQMNPLLGPFHTFLCSVAPTCQAMGGGELPSQFTQNHSLSSRCHTPGPQHKACEWWCVVDGQGLFYRQGNALSGQLPHCLSVREHELRNSQAS